MVSQLRPACAPSRIRNSNSTRSSCTGTPFPVVVGDAEWSRGPGAAHQSDPLPRAGVEDVDVLGAEGDADVVAFARGRLAVHARAHDDVAGLQVDDRALAELLDELHAGGNAVVAQAQRARPHAE